jgi:hypothetical protein
MPRLTRFEEYRDRYPDYALEKTDDGILLMRMHRDGGPAVWDQRMHHDTANLFNDVAGDRDLRAGDRRERSAPPSRPPRSGRRRWRGTGGSGTSTCSRSTPS